MDDNKLTPNQQAAERIVQEQTSAAVEKDFHQTLNDDFQSNVQLGPANQGRERYWLYDSLIYGFTKRKGIGKVLYLIVVASVFALGYWLLSKITSV